MRKKLIVGFLVIGLAMGLSFSAFSGDKEKDKERRRRNEFYRQLEVFSDALSLVDGEYVEQPGSKELIYGALKGMLSSLDPYSEFLDPERYAELKVDTEGKFGGLGIEITIKDDLLTIITPIEDTPAWNAGLKAGDRIVKIDGELTRNITASDAVKKLRGKPGTEVALTILREGAPNLFEVKLIRDIIKIKDIKVARILEDNIGYVRLSEFRENTPKDIDLALIQLKKSGMDSLILDLRNNPGGLLDVAVKVAEKFIPYNQVIVSIKGRVPSQNTEFKSANGLKFLDIPLVVLVNEGSASGSEIVAGALQDCRQAVIVGNKTFGKGSVQSVLPLSDGSALKLTTSKYFTPLGKTIHNQGVIPDIIVASGRLTFVADETALGDALRTARDKESKSREEQPQEEEPVFDYKDDNQIIRAIDVIKGIKVYKGLQPQLGRKI